MKKLFCIIAIMMLASGVMAQKKVAILETVDRAQNIGYGVKLLLRSSLTTAISSTPGYDGYDRVDMASIAGEQEFQRTGNVSDDQIKQLGIATGASYVLVAEAAKYDEGSIIITAKILDVETYGIFSSAVEVSGTAPKEMQKSCSALANQLLSSSTGGSVPKTPVVQQPVQHGGNNTQPPVSNGRNKTFTVNGVTFEMVAVKGGTFTMGATSEQGVDAFGGEKPTHSVTLSDCYIGKFEVTQELWEAVMGSNPSRFKGSKLPVEQVNWYDAVEFCNRLSEKTGRKPYYNIGKGGKDPNNDNEYDELKWIVGVNPNSNGFRLPTEAEWEYAARGGNKSKGYKYSGSNNINDVALYTANYYDKGSSSAGCGTRPVGTKSPNELGIYDMSGNVCEWCQDWYGSYGSGSQTNPNGPSSGSARVCRGGSWHDSARHCRVSDHSNYAPVSRYYGLGFRLATSK